MNLEQDRLTDIIRTAIPTGSLAYGLPAPTDDDRATSYTNVEEAKSILRKLGVAFTENGNSCIYFQWMQALPVNLWGISHTKMDDVRVTTALLKALHANRPSAIADKVQRVVWFQMCMALLVASRDPEAVKQNSGGVA